MTDEQSSTSNERSPWLVPGVLAFVLLAVAGGSVVVAFTDPPEFPHVPPDKPANLTNESAVEFVQRYEYARVYDGLASGASEVELTCDAALLNRTDRGFNVSVECQGYASGSNFDADYFGAPVTYFVNESVTRRLWS